MTRNYVEETIKRQLVEAKKAVSLDPIFLDISRPNECGLLGVLVDNRGQVVGKKNFRKINQHQGYLFYFFRKTPESQTVISKVWKAHSINLDPTEGEFYDEEDGILLEMPSTAEASLDGTEQRLQLYFDRYNEVSLDALSPLMTILFSSNTQKKCLLMPDLNLKPLAECKDELSKLPIIEKIQLALSALKQMQNIPDGSMGKLESLGSNKVCLSKLQVRKLVRDREGAHIRTDEVEQTVIHVINPFNHVPFSVNEITSNLTTVAPSEPVLKVLYNWPPEVLGQQFQLTNSALVYLLGALFLQIFAPSDQYDLHKSKSEMMTHLQNSNLPLPRMIGKMPDVLKVGFPHYSLDGDFGDLTCLFLRKMVANEVMHRPTLDQVTQFLTSLSKLVSINREDDSHAYDSTLKSLYKIVIGQKYPEDGMAWLTSLAAAAPGTTTDGYRLALLLVYDAPRLKVFQKLYQKGVVSEFLALRGGIDWLHFAVTDASDDWLFLYDKLKDLGLLSNSENAQKFLSRLIPRKDRQGKDSSDNDMLMQVLKLCRLHENEQSVSYGYPSAFFNSSSLPDTSEVYYQQDDFIPELIRFLLQNPESLWLLEVIRSEQYESRDSSQYTECYKGKFEPQNYVWLIKNKNHLGKLFSETFISAIENTMTAYYVEDFIDKFNSSLEKKPKTFGKGERVVNSTGLDDVLAKGKANFGTIESIIAFKDKRGGNDSDRKLTALKQIGFVPEICEGLANAHAMSANESSPSSSPVKSGMFGSSAAAAAAKSPSRASPTSPAPSSGSGES